MSDLHPHWQATDGESPVPVRVKTVSNKRAAVNVSRMPAATVGMLAVVATAFFALGGRDLLTGQVALPTPDVTIRITQDGPVPPSAEIRPGQTIRFVNEDQIPHVLTSDTLPTDDGQSFSSPGLFTNEDYFYTVPANAPAGTHDYISETEEEVTGEIVIVISAATASSASSAAVVLQPVSSTPAASANPISSVPVFVPASSTPSFPQPTPSSVAVQLPGDILAVNPYVVGRTGSSGSRRPSVTQHTPNANAQSGPALWVAGIASVLAIFVATRGAFRKI